MTPVGAFASEVIMPATDTPATDVSTTGTATTDTEPIGTPIAGGS